MQKHALIERVRAALESAEVPCEPLDSQPGLQWFMPLSEEYQQDYAVGELFFVSDITDQDMNGVEVAQINAVFKREIDPAHIDALRAFFAKVNRLVTGGRFEAQQEETCFAEYGHDVILPLDMTDELAERAVTAALELMTAYIGLVYEGVSGITNGELTPDQAMETLE